jgi:hypothetical protein
MARTKMPSAVSGSVRSRALLPEVIMLATYASGLGRHGRSVSGA